MKINIEGLRFNLERLEFKNGAVKAYKISEKAAMEYTRKKYMKYARKYPTLSVGEHYEGYVIFNFGRHIRVGYMEGKLIPDGDNGYKVIGDGEEGVCFKVITFGGCDFSREIEFMQMKGLLKGVDADQMEAELQQKLVSAAVNWRKEELILSDDERMVMTGYFGQDWSKFTS